MSQDPSIPESGWTEMGPLQFDGNPVIGVSEPEDTPAAARPSIRKVAAVLMSGALLSKGLGFVREIIMAQVIGIALIADGFRTSITIILLPLAFLQNESVPAILIPIMQEGQRKGDSPQRLAALTTALTLIGVLLMLGLEIGGAYLVDAMVGGFTDSGQALTLHFVRIMALSMPASVLINCLAAGEITLGKTRLTNARACVLNVGVIVGLGMFVLTGNVSMLAWVFSLAFNLLAVFGCWVLWREGNLSFVNVGLNEILAQGVDFLRRLRPFLALPAAEQGNVWLERLLASRLTTGAVASLDYARTLTDSALLLISQPVGLAVLSGNPSSNIREQAVAIARPVLALALPMSAFVYCFAPDIVRLVFHRGAFGENGVTLTSQALRGISVGLWASTLGWILLRILNSSKRNLRAAVVLITAYVANFAINLLTAKLQQSTGIGVMILGLGETTRSLVLLGGVLIALEGRGRLALLIATSMIPAAAMLALGWQIGSLDISLLGHLFLGGLACIICILFAVALLMPSLYQSGYARGRTVLRRYRSR